MTEQMPKEQYEYIKRIQDDMLECTNMTENEAWDFAFRCWQCGYNKINKEIEQYRALGTVEELRVARDKQIPQQVRLYIGQDMQCPVCNKRLRNYEGTIISYCKFCGQALKR